MALFEFLKICMFDRGGPAGMTKDSFSPHSLVKKMEKIQPKT
jgi:hypothetical protein